MAEITTKESAVLQYKRPSINRGYANQTLHIDLSSLEISIEPVSEKMKQVFIGGKGFDLWLLWNAVSEKPGGMILKMPSALPRDLWAGHPHFRDQVKVLLQPFLQLPGFQLILTWRETNQTAHI